MLKKQQMKLSNYMFFDYQKLISYKKRSKCIELLRGGSFGRPPLTGRLFPFLEVARLVEADLGRRKGGRSFENRSRFLLTTESGSVEWQAS